MAKRNMYCIKSSFGKVQISNHLLDIISVEAKSDKVFFTELDV